MIYGRQSCDTRKLEGTPIDVGNVRYGGQEALVVLDHVFIPNEYIFLNGEYEFAGTMVERFAGYHRQSYGGCKSASATSSSVLRHWLRNITASKKQATSKTN